jgi:hypothetical protein
MAECRSLRLACLNGVGAALFLFSACAYAFEPEPPGPPAAGGEYAVTMAHLLTCRTSPRARADAVQWLRQNFGEVHAGSLVLAPSLVIEKFTNAARGTWTLLRTTAGGKSCLVREGLYRPDPVEVRL